VELQLIDGKNIAERMIGIDFDKFDRLPIDRNL